MWPIKGIHLNEGHTAFAALGLLEEGLILDEIRKKLHFTTHTPVPAGHDVFEFDRVRKVIGDEYTKFCSDFASNGKLSMSHLAINVSQTCNAVSKLEFSFIQGNGHVRLFCRRSERRPVRLPPRADPSVVFVNA